MTKFKFKKSFILLFTLLYSSYTNASYYGRFISGGFFSKEVFRNNPNDRFNDVAILSERLYLSVDKILDTNHEFIVDLRDKNNFFDRLNNETLKLTSKNKLQLYQLYIHNTKVSEGLDYSVGRFPVADAGAIVADGVDLGIKKTLYGYATKFAFFYGLNPQLLDEETITFNQNSKVYGGYFFLTEKGTELQSHLYSTTAAVKQTYKSDTDRFYIYNNTNVQSIDGQNFSSILYLDLEPKINIQNLWTSYATAFPNKYRLRTTLSSIDSLHYLRIQDIRETLPSSRFNQASASLRNPSAYNGLSMETKLSFGIREVDKKTVTELKFRTLFPKIVWEEFSGTLSIAAKKNFISNDLIFGGSLIHSNKKREISLSQDLQLQRRPSLPMNYAFVTEGSYTKFIDRSLFGILSLQNIYDKNVSIFSVLFKISYRFGEGGQAPIRDGSAPVGQL